LGNQLAKFTGLDAAYLKQQNLREPDVRFLDDLLKDKNRSIGRYDARFTGIRLKPETNDAREFDPSGEAVFGSFTSAFNDYVRRDLNLATPYFAAESVIHGLNLDPAIRENVQFTFYEAGHMLYIRKRPTREI
jgi:carboxypeptidase C (cathepsin A)